jgi:hypothetical protein
VIAACGLPELTFLYGSEIPRPAIQFAEVYFERLGKQWADNFNAASRASFSMEITA